MPFSRRTPAVLSENPISRAIRARPRPYLDLTESNPTRTGLSPGAAALRRALATSRGSVYAPHPRGLRSAREGIARRARGRGEPIDPDRIVLAASTSEAYSQILKLLCDPGDTVLVPQPSYPLFDHLTDLEAVRRLPYRLEFSAQWAIDRETVEQGLANGARAVFCVHPNNPTGSFLSGEDLDWLDRRAAEASAAVVCDEVFLDYRFSAELPPAPSAAPRARGALTFSLGGLSKSCALPHVKLAWIAVGGPEALVAEAMERLDLISDTYLSVASSVQEALPALLSIGERAAERVRKRLAGNLAELDATVASLPDRAGASRLPVEGGWSAALRLPATLDEEETVLALLAEEDVLVHPGFFFGYPFEAVLVLSLLPEPGAFREAMFRIARYLEKTLS
jgi:alanine-synthesizing transaminase